MSRQQPLQASAAPPKQSHRGPHRSYTLAQLCEALSLPVSSYYDLKRAGKLPFAEELLPRVGKHPRFRADLIDQYLSGEWNRKRA